jgi:hypothetical protein
MTVEAYPLQWPDGWPRTAFNLRESDRKFGGHVYGLTMGRARDQHLDELRLPGARDIVVSTNVQLRRDRLPYDQRRIEDPGVAVYFMLEKRPLVMARDRFISVAGQYALAHTRGRSHASACAPRWRSDDGARIHRVRCYKPQQFRSLPFNEGNHQ